MPRQVNKNGIPIASDCARTRIVHVSKCTKDIYRSEAEARAIALVRRLGGKLRAYRCKVCSKDAKGTIWHLTKLNENGEPWKWTQAR